MLAKTEETTNDRGKEMEWSLRNDQIVLLVVAGTPHSEIAKQFGLTRQRVTQIMATAKAKEMVAQYRQRLQEHLLSSIEGQLDESAKLAAKAIKKTLEADISAFHKAKSNQDRVAIKLLEGKGFLNKKEERADDAAMQVTNEQFNKLMAAISKSDEAAKIRVVEAEVIEEGEPARAIARQSVQDQREQEEDQESQEKDVEIVSQEEDDLADELEQEVEGRVNVMVSEEEG